MSCCVSDPGTTTINDAVFCKRHWNKKKNSGKMVLFSKNDNHDVIQAYVRNTDCRANPENNIIAFTTDFNPSFRLEFMDLYYS